MATEIATSYRPSKSILVLQVHLRLAMTVGRLVLPKHQKAQTNKRLKKQLQGRGLWKAAVPKGKEKG